MITWKIRKIKFKKIKASHLLYTKSVVGCGSSTGSKFKLKWGEYIDDQLL